MPPKPASRRPWLVRAVLLTLLVSTVAAAFFALLSPGSISVTYHHGIYFGSATALQRSARALAGRLVGIPTGALQTAEIESLPETAR